MSEQFPSIRRQKRTPKPGISIAVLILLAVMSWSVYASKTNDSTKPATADESLLHDVETVYKWSGSEYRGGAEGARWSFRWDGRSDREAAEELAASLGFTLSSELVESEPVDIMAENETARMKLWIQSRPQAYDSDENKPFELVLLLDMDAGADQTAIAEALKPVNQATKPLDMQAGFTVRGEPIRTGSVERLEDAASAQEVEAYDDGHTKSLTYSSKLLRTSVRSGGADVNLQLAESAAIGGGSPELIIGVPLITGDYTLQNN
ncbi:YwmB family TATA-box binding protein [Paenibacillus silvisoli]|uniref:YwmB family TATA-box binding protein n=1 Tax=Paenibacillus silvisoli TaxID=3110539 RepID=UPI00280492D6|nr:YwmB family TATA-box binding protein [Paenibacillus silvisoli]